jgi:hypothetical protein
MSDRLDDIIDIHTNSYYLYVDPFVQVDFDRWDNWTMELLRMGFCLHGRECMLEVTGMCEEERSEMKVFLDGHGIRYYLVRSSRDTTDELLP